MAPRRRSVLAAAAAGATVGTGGCLDLGGSDAACTHESPDAGRLGGTPADAWPMRGYDPAATGANLGASPPAFDGATVTWSASLDAAPAGQPLVAGDGVFLRTEDRFLALDPGDGSDRWSLGGGDGPRVYGYALGDGVAYLGRWDADGGGHLLAVDAATGDERWREPAKRIPDAVAVTDEEVVVGTVASSGGSDGWVHSFDPGDGSERWRAELDDDVRTRPVVTADLVFAGTGDRELLALDRSTGGECWRVDADVSPSRGAVADGRVYLAGGVPGTARSQLVVHDAADGSVLWGLGTVPGESITDVRRVAVADGTVLVSNDAAVHALTGDGGRNWTRERSGGTGDGWATRVLAVAGGTLVTDAPGGLVALDPSTGDPTGSLSVEDRVAGLSAAGGSLYATTAGQGGPRVLAIR